MLLSPELERLIRTAVNEDIGGGDVTTESTVSPAAVGRGRIVAKEELILAGSGVAQQVFLIVDSGLKVALPFEDGARAQPGDSLLEVEGSLAAILTAERTA